MAGLGAIIIAAPAIRTAAECTEATGTAAPWRLKWDIFTRSAGESGSQLVLRARTSSTAGSGALQPGAQQRLKKLL